MRSFVAASTNPAGSEPPKTTNPKSWFQSLRKAVPQRLTLKRSRDDPNPNYDAVLKKDGIKGVLQALKADYEKAFIDANKAFMAACRSLSNAEYEDVSQFFGLDSSADAPFDGWADLIIPPTLLPTTVVSDLVSQILSSHISPGNPKTLKNEASTMAFSAGPFQTLVCLFGGAMKDRPKQVLPATELSSSGRVQCEVFCGESLLLFLRELKFDVGKNLPKAVAQVLCELYAAWHLNRRFHDDIPPARLPPVRACLRDASTAYFVGYDGRRFSRLIATSISPQAALEDHVWASLEFYQISFSILFEGYLNAVKLCGQRSLSRSQAGDPQARGSHRAVQAKLIQALPMAVSDRESTRQWKTAIEHAYKAAGYLQKAQSIRSNDAAKKGLESLQDSLQAWPTKACSPMLKQQRDEYQALIVARYESTLTEDSEMEQWSPEIPADVLSFNLDAVRRDVVENFWKGVALPPTVRTTVEQDLRPPGMEDMFDVLQFYGSRSSNKHVVSEFQRCLGVPLANIFLEELGNSFAKGDWVF